MEREFVWQVRVDVLRNPERRVHVDELLLEKLVVIGEVVQVIKNIFRNQLADSVLLVFHNRFFHINL